MDAGPGNVEGASLVLGTSPFIHFALVLSGLFLVLSFSSQLPLRLSSTRVLFCFRSDPRMPLWRVPSPIFSQGFYQRSDLTLLLPPAVCSLLGSLFPWNVDPHRGVTHFLHPPNPRGFPDFWSLTFHWQPLVPADPPMTSTGRRLLLSSAKCEP